MGNRKEKGITLIALIITVILLVILAVVTINAMYKSRIISYATQGAIDYRKQGINENKILEGTENVLDSVLSSLEGIGTIPAPIISIPEANGENNWHNTEDVVITIKDGSINEELSTVTKIVYTLDGNTKEVEGKTATVRIDTDGIHKIKAYATDGEKRSEETEEYIVKRDVSDPSKVELSTPTKVTTREITVTAVAKDETSGIKKYKFELSTEEDFSGIIEEKTQEYTLETATTEERTQEHTFSGLNDGTPYYIRVIVTDEAGRTATSSTVAQNTVVANTPPSKAQVSYKTKGTNYITVNAKSEDVDGDTLTYTLRCGTDQNNLNISTDLSGQTQDVQVPIQSQTSLTSYEYYYWRVDVSDGKVTTEGDVQARVRTYCQASSCNGGTRWSSTCTACGGNGSKEVTCSTCGGDRNCALPSEVGLGPLRLILIVL